MDYVFEKKAKLVGKIGSGKLWLLNITDDWIHDQYGDSHIYYGTIHSSNQAFHPVSTSITGYFQDEDTKGWIKVKDGVAILDEENPDNSWKTNINEFVKISIKTGVYRKVKFGKLSNSI